MTATGFAFAENIVSFLLNKLLYSLNYSVNWVESLSYSNTVGITISAFETVVLYFIIIAVLLSISSRKSKFLRFALFLLILFTAFQLQEKKTMQDQRIMVVYDTPSTSVIDFMDGFNNYTLYLSDTTTKLASSDFYTQNFRWERRLKKQEVITSDVKRSNFYRSKNFVQFFNKKILLWDDGFVKPENISATSWDYIIVSAKTKINLENINVKQLIIESSVPYYNFLEIKKECLKWDIPFYNVNESGAFIYSSCQ